jgi:mannose-6-phosphate isomerase class I
MDDVSMSHDGAAYTESIDTFRHIYVQSGVVDVNANGLTVTASTGHSVFVPAGCGSYTVSAKGNSANVLISY